MRAAGHLSGRLGDALRSAPRVLAVIQSFGVLAMLVVVVVVVGALQPRFLTSTSVLNIMVNASILAVAGFGMTFAVALAGIDLSVGSVQGLAAVLAADFANKGSTGAALSIGLLVGVAIGLTNGVVISKLRVPSFVATLGMMSAARGAAVLYTGGASILITNSGYPALNTARVAGLPLPFIVAVVLFAALWVVLRHTRFGRHVIAVGGNESAATAAGLSVDRITIAVFTIAATAAALSGVMLGAQLGTVDGLLGSGFELNVIAVAVLGGTSLTGGMANLPGTFVASLLISTITAALDVLGIQSFYQYLAVGLLLIGALALETLRRRFLLAPTSQVGG